MTTLVLDTATDQLVVALAHGEAVIHERTSAERAQQILQLVDLVLADAALAPTDVERIAVGTGPGGFTGLRVGVATARGLASALQLPLAGLSTLAAIALPRARDTDGPVWAVCDAKRGEVFARAYRYVSGVAGPAMVAHSGLLVLSRADLAERMANESVLGADIVEGTPSAAGLAALSACAAYGDPSELVPLYGRDPDAIPAASVARV